MVQRKSEGPSVEGRVPTRSILLAFAIIVGCVLCFFLAVPFIGASTAALTLAVIFAPMQAMLERRLRYRGVAAMISLVVIIVVVAVPASFVIERLVAEAAGNARVIQFRIASGEFQRFMDQHPRLAPIGRWIADQVDIPSLASGMATWLSNLGASFVRGSLVQVAVIGLTFYLLFYFLRDRKEARALLIDLLPLTPAESDRVFGRVIDTVRAIVYGTMAVALVQGALGGMMFWLLGIPAALLWGLVMTILSIVPVLGSFVVWIPASVLLAADGRWVHAIVLALWGAVVISNIDNILRPMLVGNRLRLHTVPAFISMVGGLLVFGMSGFILGPLAVTVTVTLIDIWRERE
ncbi:putative PurR-regulated permease PerM [Kaistia hirudinis]|jgi:predicted PurR-regulated permease PerM|uniref:Putative PurR-regulated permease PerM n=1 Tax=Kaistia hirudinis TaxID=1293440 RepID=A0A840ANI5_9HYPH|nr:AI-2E family transporter [Kaistia hirudinis]MBB3929976.1 putative PurR-regulated permease PerM [Kaistia hirudinis]MBN9020498.1 AI-2E family transporter [Hyphomicrobiales bacterium]